MIIYFTGTGNSRYIAELMANRLGDSAIDAASLIKRNEQPDFVSEMPYVFVAPTYAWRMPQVFEDWIKGCSFKGSSEAYFVLSCGGEIGAAGNYIAKLANAMGFRYMGTAEVVMPENYLIMFEPTVRENDAEIIKAAKEQALKLCEQISCSEAFNKVKIPLVGYLESGIVNRSFYKFYVGADKFFATDACISCGKCAENCMLNNITFANGKPVWGKNCTHCLACICKCPTLAIEYGKNTAGKRRYLFNNEAE